MHPTLRAATLLGCALGAVRVGCPPMLTGELESTPNQGRAEAPLDSPGGVEYTVDPLGGDDDHDGRSRARAWRTFRAVNRVRFGPGDRVTVLPGVHRESLRPVAFGTKARPVVVRFAPGRHEFRAEGAVTVRRFVSNSADAPVEPRPVAILVQDARHLRFEGRPGSEVWLGDRMTYAYCERSEGVAFVGLTFDMVRPTVSEFRVLEAGPREAVVRPAEGCSFAVEERRFRWTGDLGTGWTMVQEADPAARWCRRRGAWDVLDGATAEDLGDGRVRFAFAGGNPGLVVGRSYQFRNVHRDTTSLVNDRCRDVTFQDCRFHALPGMGIVSQFTANLTFRRVGFEPRPGSLRTCPAWADCLHFSNCGGRVRVEDCRFSGTQDDPINVHGTHLRLVRRLAPDKVVVGFAHPQTFGFVPYAPGDRMAFVSHESLLAYAEVGVLGVARQSDHEWLVTLDRAAPPFAVGDVVDNASWHPDVTIRGCRFDTDSCRGVLVTSAGRVLIEGNAFVSTTMSAIDIADDANSWFESGAVRDVTIRRNRFEECGSPVIFVHPEAPKPAGPVHRNIRIVDNRFEKGGVSARGVLGLVVRGNRFGVWPPPIETSACPGLVVTRNSGLRTGR